MRRIFIISLLSSITLQVISTRVAADTFVDEFGITTGRTINNGFVFVDGQYVEAPYILSRRGLGLYVNGRKIERPKRHMELEPMIGNVDINELPNDGKQKLFRALEATRQIYEKYLERGYAYFFFNDGGQIKLSPYTAAYDLPEVVQLLASDKPRQEKLDKLLPHNWHLHANMEVLVDNFSASSQLMVRLDEKAQELLRVDEFGAADELIDNGFIFLNGKYLDVPYHVTRNGLGIFVNGKMIERPIRWPANIFAGDTDPCLPSEINSETSVFDEIVTNYILEKHAYLRKHNAPSEERRIMEQVWRSMPFVTQARLDENRPHILHITTTEGVTIPQSLISIRGREVSYDENSVLQRLEKRWEYWKAGLRNGGCYLLTRKGGIIRLNANSVKNKLPKVIGVLRTSQPVQQKIAAIKKDLDVSPSALEEIVVNFSASPQLEQRLVKLEDQGN